MDPQVLLVGLLALIVGLAFTFFGYRLFLLLLPIWGFLVGFFFGANLATVVFGNGFLADVTGWLVGILVGIVFAIVSYLWYWLAVTLLAASVGYAVGIGLMRWIGAGDATVHLIVGVLVAVLFAVVAIWMRLPKFLAIWLTAFGGAFTAVSGVAVLLRRIPVSALESGSIGAYTLDSLSFVWLVAAIVLAVVGAVFQTANTSEFEVIGYSRYRNPGRRRALDTTDSGLV